MKKLILTLLFLTVSLPVFSQAGKLEKSVVRLKLAAQYGIYESDWEKRNQTYTPFYRRMLEENWKDQNKAAGGKLGLDYYASLSHPLFTHLLFGISYGSLSGNFPGNRYGFSQINPGTYKSGLTQTELTFGTVIAPFESFRVIPKFVFRSINQNLKNKNMYLESSSDLVYLSGSETYKASTSLGYLGLGLEYDLTPTLTLYFDSLLFSNLLVRSDGKYTVESRMEGYLLSNTTLASYTTLESSQGTFKVSGNRFLLGISLKLSDTIKVFFATEKDIIVTDMSNSIGSAGSIYASLTTRNTRLAGDLVQKTLYDNIFYSERRRLETTTLQLGISKDFNL
ncbi:hypothetical protein [Leptospira idonii]|uniref:Porin n=1 Tax=Leptospira idonii TaxID=1193500 RepID=A0A4R9LU84_9LEPT|nr:hypothetical protein [Leptospira idonii]TGN17336.1 hypothetical protein EHS15_17535 [Leptospira idonii]